MTRPRRRSRFRSGAPALAAPAVALAIAAGVAALPRAAAAQACCVGTGLVTPGRLRTFEDRGGRNADARAVGDGRVQRHRRLRDIGGRATAMLGFEEDLFGEPAPRVAFPGRPFCAVRTDRARDRRPVGLRRRAGRRRRQRALRRRQRGRARPLAGHRDHRRPVRSRPARPPTRRARMIRCPPPAPARGSFEGNLGPGGRRDRRQRLRLAGGLDLEAQRARRGRRRAVVRATPDGAAVRRVHVRARHHRRRLRVAAAPGRRARRQRRDREQQRRAGDRRRRAGAAVLAVVAPADDAVQRRPDRGLGPQSDGRLRRHPGDHPLLDLTSRGRTLRVA